MRAQDLTPVNEVSMTPRDFAQALDQAGSAGVLIGFEFEAYVKAANLGGGPGGDTLSRIGQASKSEQQSITEYAVDNLSVNSSNIDDIDRALQYNPRYPKIKYADAWRVTQRDLIDRVKRMYEQLHSDHQKHLKKQIMQQLARTDTGKQTEARFAAAVANDLGHWGLSNLIKKFDTRDTDSRTIQFLNNVCYYVLSNQVRQNNTITDWPLAFSIFPELEQHVADYFDEADDYYVSYRVTAQALKPILSQAVGRPVHVFDTYHARKKNATDWYIEPDGSVDEPEPGEQGLEIVTPPLDVPAAMQALQTFYSLAEKYQFRTTGAKGATGLHINMSIPDKVDPMKLALFLGDQHVLQSFGRENNDYARSVLAQLRDWDYADDASWRPVVKATREKQKGGRALVSQEFRMKALKDIAADVMDYHTVSISGENKKYFSFRHAGGDYLADMGKVINTVGRFARALLIASDPNAYRREYMTKLSQLVGPTAFAPQLPDNDQAATKQLLLQLVQSVRSQGWPLKHYWVVGQGPGPEAVARELRQWQTHTKWKQLNAQQMTQILQSAAASNPRAGEFLDNIRQDPTNYSAYFVGTATQLADLSRIKPDTLRYELRRLLDDFKPSNDVTRASTRGRTHWIGSTRQMVPASDPRVTALLSQLLTLFKQYTAWSAKQQRGRR